MLQYSIIFRKLIWEAFMTLVCMQMERELQTLEGIRGVGWRSGLKSLSTGVGYMNDRGARTERGRVRAHTALWNCIWVQFCVVDVMDTLRMHVGLGCACCSMRTWALGRVRK